jgi:RNA-binding protein
LHRIGHVLQVNPDRNLILKAEKLPRIGAKVIDEKLKPVGKVFDIFGPVSSPYVKVKTKVKETERFIGCALYVTSRN